MTTAIEVETQLKLMATTCEYILNSIGKLSPLKKTSSSSPVVADGVKSGAFYWAGVSNRRSRSRVKQLEASSLNTLPQPFFFPLPPRSSFFSPLPPYCTSNITTCPTSLLPPQASKTISSTGRDGGALVPILKHTIDSPSRHFLRF